MVEEQLEEMEMSLVKYKSALNYVISVVKWVRVLNTIKQKKGCLNIPLTHITLCNNFILEIPQWHKC